MGGICTLQRERLTPEPLDRIGMESKIRLPATLLWTCKPKDRLDRSSVDAVVIYLVVVGAFGCIRTFDRDAQKNRSRKEQPVGGGGYLRDEFPRIITRFCQGIEVARRVCH